MKTKIFIIFLAILTAVLSGCAQDPTAVAGDDQTIVLGETVTLSAAASDKNGGDSLSYTWSIISAPEGSQAKLSDPAAMEPTFTPDKSGEYLFRLVVYNSWQSDPVEVKINCTPETVPPVVDPPVVDPPVVDPPVVDPPNSEPPVTDGTGTIEVTALYATENFRNATNVNFSTKISITNSGATRVNVGVPIFGKDAAGITVFTRNSTYAINAGETRQSTTSYGEPLTIAEYDSITTWTVGEIVIY